jgi:hypothetical protein
MQKRTMRIVAINTKYRTKTLKCFPSKAFNQNACNPCWVSALGDFAVLFLIFCPVLSAKPKKYEAALSAASYFLGFDLLRVLFDW